MELRPHLLLEGLVAAMRFCETDEAFIYLREEYATSRARLLDAIAERGLNVHVVVGAGSYVCGEESAMLESMEGRRGMPRLRPPFPAQKGYLGRPTLINNVETLVHVARILRGEWTPARLWSVSGAVREPGCYEAPLDVTIRALVDGYAGGFDGDVGAVVPGRRRERDPAAGGARRPAHARRAPRVGKRPRIGGGAGLPGLVPGAPPARRDDAVLRRGVVPEVHAVPDREPRAPPRGRGARARPRGDDAARRSTSGWRRWRRPRSAASARPRRSRSATS